ncbi:MAG: hypothetical protein WC789_06780 [Lentisphaeria bacterium]
MPEWDVLFTDPGHVGFVDPQTGEHWRISLKREEASALGSLLMRMTSELERENRLASREPDSPEKAERLQELALRFVSSQERRWVIWAFDRGPQGRPVASAETDREAVRLARAQLQVQASPIAPAIQVPFREGGGWWVDWPVWEARWAREAREQQAATAQQVVCQKGG